MRLATSMARLGVESSSDVLLRARELGARRGSVMHLDLGDPDFPTPCNVVEATKRALDSDTEKSS
jgi:aspartate aminotransferase